MNTIDFFNLVLPDEGKRCVAIPTPKGGFRHIFTDTNEDAAEVAEDQDNKGRNVYFGVASFKSDENRKGENAHAFKTFIADIDCGTDKPYADKREGAKAALAFAQSVGLPKPYLVSSGNGVHVYWPLDESIDPATWRRTAALLKAVMAHAGLSADPSRTSDMASVLRVPGTHHRKAEPKPVKVVYAGEVTSHPDILAALEGYAGLHQLTPPNISGPRSDLNSDLKSGQEYPPSNAEKIAEECAVVARMRDTRGNIEEPTWYGVLGVVGHCVEGDRVAHEWSDGHPDYSEDGTDSKLSQARLYPPTTCAKLGEHNPSLCKACPHFNKIKSPIVLGYAEASTPAVVTRQDDRSNFAAFIAARRADVPRGYIWEGGLCRLTQKDEEKKDDNDSGQQSEPTKECFCDTMFWPLARIEDRGVYAMEIEMHVRDTELRRFTVDAALIGRGGAELSAHLAQYELVAKPRMDHILHGYMRHWLDIQRRKADETRTFKNFGWHGRNFLVGDTLYTPAGAQSVLLSGNAKQRQGCLGISGDYDVWKQTIDRLYNHPDHQALQYLVLCGFAAPLFGMFGDYGGVTVYAYSGASGEGKTTAQCASLSVWGHWHTMKANEGKVTGNALWALLGTYSSIPFVYDELTTQDDARVLADLVFSISGGSLKERCDTSGQLRDNNSNWRTIVSASGNKPLTDKLATFRANAEAEISRVFEFAPPNFAPDAKPVQPNEAALIVPRLLDHHGHAGKEFIEYVVTNYDEVFELLQTTRQKLNDRIGIRQSERYWSVLHASVITALLICRKLEILRFETKPLIEWLQITTNLNRVQRSAAVSPVDEQFARMLADLAPGVLVTEGAGDLRSGADAIILQDPRGPMTGRAIVPARANEQSVLYLTANAIRDWCAKANVSAKAIFDYGVQAGWVAANIDRVALGRGSFKYASVSAQVRVWVIDPNKISDAAAGPLGTKLKVVSNGTQQPVRKP